MIIDIGITTMAFLVRDKPYHALATSIPIL